MPWDDRLEGGEHFRDTIERQLAVADLVIVVWSERARTSRWVLDEAERGAQRGVLLPIRLDATALPLGFGGFQVVDFSNWDGDYQREIWRRFLRRIAVLPNAKAVAPQRIAASLARQIALVTLMWGTAIGGVLWTLYSPTTPDDVLGHPLLDAVALASLAALPVVLWSAVEVRRAGFKPLRQLIRRSARWLLIGALAALLILILAVAAGGVSGLSPRAALLQIARVFVAAAVASAAVVALFNIARWKIAPPG